MTRIDVRVNSWTRHAITATGKLALNTQLMLLPQTYNFAYQIYIWSHSSSCVKGWTRNGRGIAVQHGIYTP